MRNLWFDFPSGFGVLHKHGFTSTIPPCAESEQLPAGVSQAVDNLSFFCFFLLIFFNVKF